MVATHGALACWIVKNLFSGIRATSILWFLLSLFHLITNILRFFILVALSFLLPWLLLEFWLYNPCVLSSDICQVALAKYFNWLQTYWGSFVLMALTFLLARWRLNLFMVDHALWITVALVYLTSILNLLQVITSSTAWDHVLPHLKPSFNVLVELLMRSRAESTIRAYLAKIKAFSCWCRNKCIAFQLPIPSSVASMYLADYFENSKLRFKP